MDTGVISTSLPITSFAAPPLRCVVDVDTSEAPPAEQFDLFQSWHADIVDVDLLSGEFSSFAARERAWQLGDLVLASVEYPGTGYHRRWSSKKHPVFDHWLLCVPQTIPPGGGRPRTGRLRWHCLAVPHQDESEDDGVLCLFLPRDFAFSQPLTLDIRPEMAAFVSDYILLLYHSLPDRTENDVAYIGAATASLLAACVSPSRNHIFEAQEPIDAVIMSRANKFISARLADRNLTPEKLCQELGISRSRLYRIFEPAGGISHYIRRQRLLKTRDVLGDSMDGRPISSIAEEWGFVDPSTYSRTFRREFGISPKEAREAGWLGIKHAPLSERQGDSVSSLSGLLANNYLGRQL